jgi:hypothetical protein
MSAPEYRSPPNAMRLLSVHLRFYRLRRHHPTVSIALYQDHGLSIGARRGGRGSWMREGRQPPMRPPDVQPLPHRWIIVCAGVDWPQPVNE